MTGHYLDFSELNYFACLFVASVKMFCGWCEVGFGILCM